MSKELLGKNIKAHLLIWLANGTLKYHRMKGKITDVTPTALVNPNEEPEQRLVVHCESEDEPSSYRRSMSVSELGMYVGYADLSGASSTIVTLEENNPSPDAIRAGLNTAMIDALQRFRSDVSRRVDARLGDIKRNANYEIRT